MQDVPEWMSKVAYRGLWLLEWQVANHIGCKQWPITQVNGALELAHTLHSANASHKTALDLTP